VGVVVAQIIFLNGPSYTEGQSIPMLWSNTDFRAQKNGAGHNGLDIRVQGHKGAKCVSSHRLIANYSSPVFCISFSKTIEVF